MHPFQREKWRNVKIIGLTSCIFQMFLRRKIGKISKTENPCFKIFVKGNVQNVIWKFLDNVDQGSICYRLKQHFFIILREILPFLTPDDFIR